MLALNNWISIFVALWITNGSDGGPLEKASKDGSECVVTSPFNSSYVKAHLMRYTPGRGCMTNSTSPKRQEVHIINVKVKENDGVHTKRLQVNLRVEPRNILNTDVTDEYQRPLVFVLYSTVTVKWKVELIGLATMQTKHLFLVPSYSRIRFKKSKFRKHVRSRSLKMPDSAGPGDLLQWTQDRYSAVTSYSEVDGTSLLFRVGLVPGFSSDCNVTSLVASEYSAISQIQVQPTAGCVSDGMNILRGRPVYIIELLNEPPDAFGKKDSVMELEVTSINNEPINKDFYLIIKSPSSLKWAVRSRRVQGLIDIVTDADVDLKDIRMHTVALRKEVMKATGSKLIEWAEYYIARVEAYTRVEQANRIRLLLHPNKKSDWAPVPSRDDAPVIEQQVQTECKDGSMEVSIPKKLLKESGLVKEQITLLDYNCGAIENKSHVILKTYLTGCNTHFKQVNEKEVFSNAIVIHASGVNTDVVEEFGSGFPDNTEMSGSGSHDLTEGTYIDDEDFQSQRVEIDLKCEIPIGRVVIEGLDYQLHLFRDDRFLRTESSFPISAPRDSRMYVQASIMANSHLDVMVSNCWLSPTLTYTHRDAARVDIITNGCAHDPDIKWHNSPNSVSFSTQSVSRFSFLVREYFKPGQVTYLNCELAICLKDSLDKGSSIPKCQAARGWSCDMPMNTVDEFQQLHRAIGSKILVVGPWKITEPSVQVVVPSGGTSVPVDDNNQSGKSSNSDTVEGSTQLQQSVIIEGLDSATVVGIAFAAFAIGILLTGALWFIHTHTGPGKRGVSSQGSAETSGESTPNSSSPISA